MPPKFLFDYADIDLTHVQHEREEIRQFNPQRGDMEHLDGVIYADGPSGRGIGFKDVRQDEFWVLGHIPGRPLLPGVLMIEAAAQLASFYSKRYLGIVGFIGFGGCDDVKFRQQVAPGCRMYILLQKTSVRHGRVYCLTQGVVENSLVFEAEIMGQSM